VSDAETPTPPPGPEPAKPTAPSGADAAPASENTGDAAASKKAAPEKVAGSVPKKPVKKAVKKKKQEPPAPSYTLSSSPHVRRDISIRRIMIDVLLALLPATLVGLWFFGWHAVVVVLLCIGFCLGVEVVCQKLRQQKVTIDDGSAAVTGLLLAMTMPPRAEWWLCLVGAVAAIGLAKHAFGGLGYNPFNPALFARVLLLISFPAQMTAFYTPTTLGLDAVTTATPLGMLQEARIRGLGLGEAANTDVWMAFLGYLPGSLGEASTLALLLGGLFLIWRGHVRWDIPVSMLATIALFSGLFWWMDPTNYMSPWFHLCTGGVMLAAWFMATDMVTSPLTTKGKIIFGIGCGLLTVIIRMWGGYAEAVSFAILLMNAGVPIIDRYTMPRLYGTGRPPAKGPAR
jgi:electron transport complex protein RnfD